MNISYFFILFITFIYIIGLFFNLDILILFKDSNFYLFQLLTYSFIHGNFQHLLFNSIAILQLGLFFEHEKINNLILQWVVFAVGGGLMSLIFEKYPIVGASGVIMGFLTYFYFKYKEKYEMQGILILIVINIIIGFLPGISLWGHLGGSIVGFLYFYIKDK